MKNQLVLLAFVALAASACKKKEVDWATADEARGTARENATYIAQSFRRADPRFGDHDIVTRGDSSISGECPQGDGWASIDLIPKGGGETVKLKCSTVSLNIGCLTEDDFRKRDYAQEDGHCNDKLPYPLPKVVK